MTESDDRIAELERRIEEAETDVETLTKALVAVAAMRVTQGPVERLYPAGKEMHVRGAEVLAVLREGGLAVD